MSVSDAVAALRKASNTVALYESLRMGYRTVDDFAEWLEAASPIAAKVAARLSERIAIAERRLENRAETARATEVGRQVIAMFKAYEAAHSKLN